MTSSKSKDGFGDSAQLSVEEMDRAFLGRDDEINAKLVEAYEAKARGEVFPMETLPQFLARARQRLKTTR